MSTENTEREERFFTTEDIARQTATELSRAWKCVDARWERRSPGRLFNGVE
uniref:Uncharacterized protein n=1 Tax=Candidatus Kentrum sp. FM TaxID=2126340 RepID=A0A450U189_9GAMM|nr:MAG: hypothetical protein BECKFM1743C_GA0114222_109144 [Candidatus Kentron sp. FM]VFK23750.1 MAG: hypothetical protein BECKFM1743B_GA0114221_109444 [Candidatus Kentron sp. FM]